jgi:peptidoglycan/xylan/chitin deacetylase (PgdA/CDA1 family)
MKAKPLSTLFVRKQAKVASIIILAVLSFSFFASTQVAGALSLHGYISVAFDDGTQSVFDYAYPLLHARNMNATYYAIGNSVGTSNYYMNSSALLALQSSGSEIGSHSQTHASFPSLTDAQLQQECQLSKQTLQSFGLTINNFAYPYGERTNHTDQVVAQYYRSARAAYVDGQNGVPPYRMPVPFGGFVVSGFAGETGDSTALTKLKSQVDQVYSSGTWEIIFFHNVLPTASGPSAISSSDFAAFLDYIVSRGVSTLTVNEGLSLVSTPQPPSVSIFPSAATVNLGQSITFSSTVSDGQAPYTYRWVVNGAAIPSSNTPSFVFTPDHVGTYNVYANVTDSLTKTGKSNVVSGIQVFDRKTVTIATNFGTTSPASGDYDAGSSMQISATPPNVSPSMVGVERYVWKGWTGSGSGSYTGQGTPSGSSYTAQITVNSAITETAQWDHQYLVTFGVAGLSSDSTGLVATIAGSSKSLSNFPNSTWVSGGSTISFSYQNTVLSDTSGKHYALTGANASSPLTVTGSSAVLGSYKTQYYFTVTTPNDVANGSGWYDNGATAYAGVGQGIVSAGTGKQFCFTGWGSDASGVDYSKSSAIVLDGPKVATAQWKTQYYFTVTTPNDVANGSGWYDSGATAYAGVGQGIVSAGTGKQFCFTGWGSDASGVDYSKSSAIVLDGPKVATAQWKTQYYLTVTSSAEGSVSPSSGWLDEGSTVTSTANSPLAVSAGVQQVVTGWVGIGSAPASGSTTSTSFTINSPSALTWNWQTQYYLTVSSSYGNASGTGWYNADSNVTASVSPTTYQSDSGTTYTFTYWSGDVSGNSSSSVQVTMNRPKTVTANWQSGTPAPTTSLTTNPTSAPTQTATPTAKPTTTQTQSPDPSPAIPELTPYTFVVMLVILAGAVLAARKGLFNNQKPS